MKSYRLMLFMMTPALAAFAGDAPTPTLPDGAPYEITLKKDLPILGACAASAIAAFAVEHSLPRLTQEEIDGLSHHSVNRFDRSATHHYSKSTDGFSDIFVDCMLAAPLCLLTNRNVRGSAAVFSVLYAETVMLAYALPALGKGFFMRPRPFVYNPDVPAAEKLSTDARVSFFSRHTTFAFASACFMSSVFGSYNPGSKLTPFLWAGGLGAASTVGYLRFAAGAHFPTDVLTGALAGSVAGCAVPYLHRTKNAGTRLSVNPADNSICLSFEW